MEDSYIKDEIKEIKERIVKVGKEIPRMDIQKLIHGYFFEKEPDDLESEVPIKDLHSYPKKELGLSPEKIKEKIIKLGKETPRVEIQKLIQNYFLENQSDNTKLGIPIKDLRSYIGERLGLSQEEINAGFGADNVNILNEKVLKPNIRKLAEQGILKKVQSWPSLYILEKYLDFDKLEDNSEKDDLIKDLSIDLNIDQIIGDGNEFVYVFYYPVYEKLARFNNSKIWEHKIGRTKHPDPINRIKRLASGSPENPEIPLCIRTNDSSELEKFLHSYLKLKGKHVENLSGTEWFLTNKDEIKEIYLSIVNNHDIP